MKTKTHSTSRMIGRALLASASVVAVMGSFGRAGAQEATTLPAIDIAAARASSDHRGGGANGGAAAGYRFDATSTTGPWGERALQDTPYSVYSVSAPYIENRVFSTTDEVFRVNPLTQLNMGQGRGYGSAIFIRGVKQQSGFSQIDGLNMSGVTDLILPLEDKERVDVLSGLSGFLYGPAHVGGLVNFVTKRPTPTPFSSVTFGNYGGSQPFVHVDLGGPFEKGSDFGYRLNFVKSSGETAIDDNFVDRWLVSGALDWRPLQELLFQINYSHQHIYEKGTLADWGSFNGTFPHFSASILDPAKNYGQPWTFNKNDMDVLGANVTYDVTRNVKFRAAYQYVDIESENLYAGDNIAYSNGAYSYSLASLYNAPHVQRNQAWYAFTDYDLDLLPIKAKTTFGLYGSSYSLRQHQDNTLFKGLGSFPVSADPVYVTRPTFTNGAQPYFRQQQLDQTNWIIGEDIAFNDQWSLLAGASLANIKATNFNTNGTVSSYFDKTRLTPTASLIYKPLPWLTGYGTYIQSLQNGGTASTSFSSLPVTNASQALSPTTSEQVEIGAKANVSQILLTAALFQIDKANTFYKANGASYTFTNDGRQLHRGLEMTATGKIFDDLTVTGGFTLLDAKITQTNTVYLLGQPPAGSAKNMGKLYVEYRLPFVPGLTLTGGFNYVGPQVGNVFAPTNVRAIEWLPSYITGDIGLRYETRIFDTETIWRIDMTNIANASYWQQTEMLGAPRTVAFSATAKF
jgi:iron complex outermembrane recepter protein